MKQLTDKEFIADLYQSLDRFTCGICFHEAVSAAIWRYSEDDELRNLIAVGSQDWCKGPESHYSEEDEE